jgi:para-nitrobenzyl esterase
LFLRRSLASGIVLGTPLGLLPAAAQARLLPNPDSKAVVETMQGKVRGLIADGIHVFRGIPYGAPTGGAARFMPARPAAAWGGVREATRYGDQCVQQVTKLGNPADTSARRETSDLIPVWHSAQSEDCLNLNIWTPAVGDGGRRPVMVWLHPGGFEFGSANIAFNDGTNLARRGDVVVVALNQRLGPLGHLHLGEFGGDELADSANLGMLDLHLGLAWVRDNIAAFGGDPGRVLIHGESGGARKTSTLLAMPGAKGLFHRAAIQSGPALRFPSGESQTRRTRYTLRELGFDRFDLRRLQDVPAAQLVAAGMRASAKVRSEVPRDAPFYDTYGFAPVPGPALPRWPFHPTAPAIAADVPVMIGSNRHEMSLAITQDRGLDVIDGDQLLTRTRALVGAAADELLAVYRAGYPQASQRDLLLLVMADHSHRMDSILLAERKFEQGGAPVYMYRFDWESPVLDGLIKAAHTYEIPFVFDNAQLCSGMTGGDVDAVALAARMSSRGSPSPVPATQYTGAAGLARLRHESARHHAVQRRLCGRGRSGRGGAARLAAHPGAAGVNSMWHWHP